MKSVLTEMKEIVADIETDVSKAEAGVKSAAVRVRKAMQALIAKAKAMRVTALETSKTGGTDPTKAPANTPIPPAK